MTQRSGWEKEVPLTYGFQDCLEILENSGREAGSLRGCEETAHFSSLSFTKLPKPSGKASPSGQPALSYDEGGPDNRPPGSEAAGPAPPRACATSRGSFWDVTPLPLVSE